MDQPAAYDRIAPIFAELSQQRRRYLRAIEGLIVAQIPPGSGTLLDVGAGDGSRSRQIAESAGIAELTLIEPSLPMQRGGSGFQTLRAEDLHLLQPPFDVILCLWNVLGHVFPAGSRAEVLRQFARLLSSRGRAFLDVNHRYNARHYGAIPTALRFLRDRVAWSETNGDVAVTWDVHGAPCTMMGHVFTHPEMVALCRAAGLRIEQKLVIDYATGQRRQRDWEGQLLYVLSRGDGVA
jgi:2-polyprenyl-3-methyl-5-hydroxy-6-metoxy-1,4-benzoquinol methylase